MSFVGSSGVATSSAWYKAEVARLQARITELEAGNAKLRELIEDLVPPAPAVVMHAVEMGQGLTPVVQAAITHEIEARECLK